MLKTDILIIGTGIAGLSFAIKTARKRSDLSIVIMTKSQAETTNTQYAQGGIAAVMDRLTDSFEQHIADTLQSGGGLCNTETVEMVIRQAPERLQELIGLGVPFDKNHTGWDLALEGGHSQSRILHHKDNTGFEIEKTLLDEVKKLDNVTLLENHFVIDLVTEKSGHTNRCAGAFYFDGENNIQYIRSKTTVLSTGGCGQIFKNTTNASVATGDGVAIAHRVKAKIRDMQYIQFHPTAMYEPGKNPSFLLSEALRGFGAHILNQNGKRFLFAHDVRGELATRDIVSKAIAEELQKSGQKYCWLDCRHLHAQSFREHFESIFNYCQSKGIDPSRDLIPITPVAHYQCGGIAVNKHGQTTVNGLYAIGECAGTGLHGKNRLASNSLLEAIVFAHQASEKICDTIDDLSHAPKFYVNKCRNESKIPTNEKITQIRENVKTVLEQYYIDDAREKTLRDIKMLRDATSEILEQEQISRPVIELLNILTVASLIVEHAGQNDLITLNK
jgi:L-aspartate oxidase